jgi:hypothetical protein
MRLVLLALLVLSGCQILGPDDDTRYTFDYVAQDSDGRAIASGTMDLHFRSLGRGEICALRCSLYEITGSARVETTGDRLHPNLADGTRLTGYVYADSSITLDFGPPTPDQGFSLAGRFDGELFGSFSGDQIRCGFGGCLRAGSFRAAR